MIMRVLHRENDPVMTVLQSLGVEGISRVAQSAMFQNTGLRPGEYFSSPDNEFTFIQNLLASHPNLRDVSVLNFQYPRVSASPKDSSTRFSERDEEVMAVLQSLGAEGITRIAQSITFERTGLRPGTYPSSPEDDLALVKKLLYSNSFLREDFGCLNARYPKVPNS
jgi:hypothetical protein